MKIFDRDTTRSALPFDRLIPALKQAFIEGCHVPLRHVHHLNDDDPSATRVLIMPAWQDDGLMGIKTVHISPRNRDLGKPGLHSTYLLYSSKTGEPLAMINGDEITSRRTAAASALGGSFLARPDASRLFVAGTGRVGSLLPDAYAAVRDLSEVTIWDIDEGAATTLVQQLNERGFKASVAKDLETAVQQADIISCATLATAPFIKGEWLQPGSHLDLIGSFTPDMREADDDAFANARLFIDTEEALMKSGELLEPMSRQVFAARDVVATLTELCTGATKGRETPEERTVFKAVGTALEDLAAAALVYQTEDPATGDQAGQELLAKS